MLSWNSGGTPVRRPPGVGLAGKKLYQRPDQASHPRRPCLWHGGHPHAQPPGPATQSWACYGRHVVLNQNPRLACLFEPDGWTWCISNPDTLSLLRALRKELMELCGPGSYLPSGLRRGLPYATCDCCSQKDGPKLLADYLNGLTEELAAEGRRPIIWGMLCWTPRSGSLPILPPAVLTRGPMRHWSF